MKNRPSVHPEAASYAIPPITCRTLRSEKSVQRLPLSLWSNPGPDSGWSWVILICNSIFLALAFGLCTTGSIGILFVEFVAVFGISRKDAAWPFSLIGIMQCITGLCSGMVNHWFDLRSVVLLSAISCSLALVLCFWATDMTYISLVFGILFGCGNGLYMSVSLLFMNQYFKKYIATANGVFMMISPLSGLVLPYLVNSLVNAYGLRGAFLLTGGVAMQLLVVGRLMRPRTAKHFSSLRTSIPLLPPKNPDSEPDITEDQTRLQKFLNVLLFYKNAVTNPMFYVVTVQAVVSLNVLVGLSLTLADFAMDNGFTKEDGILLLVVFSVVDVIGRGVFGIMTDRFRLKKARISLGSMFVMGMSLILFGVTNKLEWFALLCAVAGLNEGGLATTANVHYTYYIEKNNLPAALGLRLCVNGLFAFVRPLLAGYFRDSYQSYIPFYNFLGGLSLFSAFLWSLEPYFVSTKTRHQELPPS